MSNLLKGAVENGTGTAVKPLKRPVAGKTGTSNEEMDTWFLGFTPEWTCGIWVGFDVKRRIGYKETGGKVAAPIFLDFMKGFLEDRDRLLLEKLVQETKSESEKLGIEYVEPTPPPPSDFLVPPGVSPYWIYKSNGIQAAGGAEGAILEYFAEGTEPNHGSSEVADAGDYLESNEL